MGNKRNFGKPKNPTLMSGAANKQFHESEFVISFKHLDRTQGQSLSEWEEMNILSKGIETLIGYCGSSIHEKKSDKFTIYGPFPPKNKTEFYHPKHVPEDAEWARIHVNGRICIIGHVVRNVFNIVFLDKEHKFWISEKKHT